MNIKTKIFSGTYRLFNPYHDVKGRFSTSEQAANRILVGVVDNIFFKSPLSTGDKRYEKEWHKSGRTQAIQENIGPLHEATRRYGDKPVASSMHGYYNNTHEKEIKEILSGLSGELWQGRYDIKRDKWKGSEK